jgi:hypothetical protein
MKYYIFSFRCLVLVTRYMTDDGFVRLSESEADIETTQSNLPTGVLPQTGDDIIDISTTSQPMFIQFIDQSRTNSQATIVDNYDMIHSHFS